MIAEKIGSRAESIFGRYWPNGGRSVTFASRSLHVTLRAPVSTKQPLSL